MKIKYFEELDSTNKYLKEVEKIENWDVVIAKKQSRGYGRRGNDWLSEEGAGTFSIALKKEHPELNLYPLIIGLGVHQAIKDKLALELPLKWPNDLYYGDKKLGGILVELKGDYLVIGIGININNEVEKNNSFKGTSLREISGEKQEYDEIIKAILKSIQEEVANFHSGGWKGQLEQINKNSYLLGKQIKINQRSGKTVEGIAGKTTESGTLEVFVDGKVEEFYAGEIHIKKINS